MSEGRRALTDRASGRRRGDALPSALSGRSLPPTVVRVLTFACLVLVVVVAAALGGSGTPAVGVIAFVREDPRPRADLNTAVDLWTVRTNGRGARAIVATRGWDEDPTWSPSGSSVAFQKAFLASGNNGDTLKAVDVWTVGADGRALRRVTRDGSASSPAWSPTGELLAFVRGDGVYVVRPDGSRQRRLARRADATTPAWSPDGRRIAFTVPGQLWVMAANGSGARLLARGASSETRAIWSPDARLLAYAGTSPQGAGLFLVSSSGGRPRLLSRLDEEARWSPDGRTIALVRTGTPQQAGIFLARSDGRERRRLTRGLDATPVWSPDGRQIAFRRGLLVGDIFVVNIDGSNLRNLTRTPQLDERQPTWRPR